MNRIVLVLSVFAFVSGLPLQAELTKAKAEPNLERRARLALDNASAQFRAASAAYKASVWPKTVSALEEMRESVDLAYTSLKETGRNPRDSRQHKNLEVKLRGLLKSLEDLRRRMAFEEREELNPLVEHLQNLHDELLQSILSPQRRKD